MTDGIIKGTGDSRYLKGAGWPATYAEFKSMAEAGTLPFDLNGINEAGWQQIGDALNKANLLDDAACALFGLPNAAKPNDAFKASAEKIASDFLALSKTANIAGGSGFTWKELKSVLPNYTGCASGNGLLLITGGSTGTSGAVTSDGENFEEVTLPLDSGSWQVIFAGDYFFQCNGTTPGKVYRSTDGKNWADMNIPFLPVEKPQFITFFNGKYFIFGLNGNYVYQNFMLTTTDFVSYERTDRPIGVIPNNSAVFNGYLYLGYCNSGTAYKTSDGITFTGITGTPMWFSVQNGKLFRYNHTTQAYSDDGEIWTSFTVPDGSGETGNAGIRDIQYLEGEYVAIKGTQIAHYSKDLVAWESDFVGTYPRIDSNDYNNGIALFDDKLYYVGIGNNIELFYKEFGGETVYTASYAGTGTSYATISVPFKPRLALICGGSSSYIILGVILQSGEKFYLKWAGSSVTGAFSSANNQTLGYILINFQATTDFNLSGVKYQILAIR